MNNACLKEKSVPAREVDHSCRELVERVVAGDQLAWTEFVAKFSRFVFSITWRYAGNDPDRCANLYLYVVEALHESSENGESFHRLRRYLDSMDRFNGTGRLTTWLGRVTQNLVSDYFRDRLGRRTLPCSIRRLDHLSQCTYKLLYWDCLNEQEAYQTLQTRLGGLEREKFEEMVEAINQRLKNCNRWSIYCEVVRRMPPLAYQPGVTCREKQCSRADPAASMESKHKQDAAKALGKVLRSLIEELPEESRNLLICRFKHGMTVSSIAKKLKRNDHKRIYSELDRLKLKLRRSLREAGFNWEGVEGGLDAIEGTVV